MNESITLYIFHVKFNENCVVLLYTQLKNLLPFIFAYRTIVHFHMGIGILLYNRFY